MWRIKRGESSVPIIFFMFVLAIMLVAFVIPAINFILTPTTSVPIGPGTPLSVLLDAHTYVIATSADAQAIIDSQKWSGVDGVYVDSVNGIAGTTGSIGTPGNPVSNLANAFTIIANRKLDKIYLIDVNGEPGYTLPSDLPYAMTFVGDATLFTSGLDLNGKNTFYSIFRNITVNGNAHTDDGVEIHNGGNSGISGGQQFLFDTEIEDPISPTQLGGINLTFRAYGAIDATNFISYTHSIYGFQGIATISNLSNATATLNITGIGGAIILDASCTGGTINLYGDITLTDNSTGTVVNNYTLQHAIATGP